jgi:hypothetical protein
MLTPEELIDRVRDSVDGVYVAGSSRDAALAILQAGQTLVGIALSHLEDKAECEFRLARLEFWVRQYLRDLAEAEYRRGKLH